MAIDGNLRSGQQLELTLPKIKINGTELHTPVKKHDERLYFYQGTQDFRANATLTLTTTETNAQIRYTFNGRNPTSKSKLYTGPIILKQNKSGDNTTIKARVFKKKNKNRVSRIIKAKINVVGGNTVST